MQERIVMQLGFVSRDPVKLMFGKLIPHHLCD